MPSKPRKTHGLNTLMRRVSARGMGAVDRRSAGYRAVKQWRCELLADLGGEQALSSQKRTLVDQATRLRLFIDAIDSWAMQQRTLVNGRKKSLAPVLGQRMELVNGLIRILGLLGLERQQPPVKSLQQYLEEHDKGLVEKPEAEPEVHE